MKIRQTKIERLLERGMLNMNEPAVAEAPAGGGGDTSAEAAPSTEAPTETSNVGEEGVDWEGIFSDTDEPSVSEQSFDTSDMGDDTAPPVAEQSAPATPEAQPSAEPAPAEQQPETPPAPVEQQQQQPVAEPAQQQISPEEYQQQIIAARDNWVNGLKEQYALTDEEATAYQDDPAAVLPQIAARMHANIFENTMQFLRQSVPGMVMQVQKTHETYEQNERDFYKEWPELEEHGNIVVNAAKMWNQQNPQGTREDFIKQVGAIAWNMAGLNLEQLVNRGNDQPPPAATPAPVQQPSGYSPAPQGGGPAMAPPPVQDNPFAAMASEWEND